MFVVDLEGSKVKHDICKMQAGCALYFDSHTGKDSWSTRNMASFSIPTGILRKHISVCF